MAFLDNGGESSPIEIDTLRNRYALTIRDEATGLADTWFRKLENRGGRWTSPDPYNGSAKIGNGQSWNRYSYVENQPTNYVDPTGLNMFNPMGVAYYVDGMLTSSWHAWSIMNAGVFDSIYSNVGGVTFEAWGHEIGPNDGFLRDYVIFHIWNFGDPLFTLGELLFTAAGVVANADKNPESPCAKLLGEGAGDKFKSAIKNIKFNETSFDNSLINGMRVGDSIYLNPNGFAFQEVRFFGQGAEKKNKAIAKQLALASSQMDYAVATIIHEFLHLIGKFGPDGNVNDTSKSEENQNRVLKACFPKSKK